VHFKNCIVNAFFVAVVSAVTACGSSSPSAPTGLPGTQNSVGSGATINGSVTGAALSGGTHGLMSLAGTGLTVTVVGTELAALIDASGHFVLSNVPAGDVQLKFSGPGTDATVTVSGVNGGEEIQLVISLNGNQASVQNLMRGDRKVEIEGLVASGTCASFVVNGTTITTNTATVFQRGTCASVTTGAKVEVKGTHQADGSVLATHVKLDDEDDGDFELEGAITAFTGCSSFTVNGTVVTTNAATQFKHGVCGDIQMGAKVEVKGTRSGDVFLATRVEFEQKNASRVELEGVVTAGGCGSFTVRGVVVTTDATTQFKNGVCGTITTGVRVHVRGTRTASGVTASLVNIQPDDDDEDDDEDEDEEEDDDDDDAQHIEVEGVVTAGSCGSFTVKSFTVTTTASTQFKGGACSNIAPGVEVEVKGTKTSATALTATRVNFED
jgi:hypothetical protein